MIKALCLYISVCLILVSYSVYAEPQNCTQISQSQVAQALNAPGLKDLISIETADCGAISISNSDIGFNLSKNTQKIRNGIRSEVAVGYRYKEGDNVTYTLDVKLPTGFHDDYPQNRWWAIMQWHDQPDIRVGENWANFPHRPPPVAIRIVSRNGVLGLAAVMFGKDEKFWYPVRLGQWMKISVDIHWSSQDDGEIIFNDLNDPNIFMRIKGRNMNNRYYHYLKFGQYRHPDIQADATVYFRNLSITTK